MRAYCTVFRAKQWHLVKCLAAFTNSIQWVDFSFIFACNVVKNYTYNMENVRVFSAEAGGGEKGETGERGAPAGGSILNPGS